ncbi:hypothetical protein QEN19_000836 [Hanseniaspora menglaensis]
MSEKIVETQVDVELYDRQIRLWGLSTQQLILNSKVLVVNLNGLGTEIVKNLLLSGIGNITVLDEHEIEISDVNTYYNQFFIYNSDLSKVDTTKKYKRLDFAEKNMKDMNPRCNLQVFTDSSEKKLLDKEFLKNFDLVITTEILNNELLSKINLLTRDIKIPLYICQSFGLSSFIFVDYIQKESILEKPLDAKKDTAQIIREKEIIQKTEFPKIVSKNTNLVSKQLIDADDGTVKVLSKFLHKFIPFGELINRIDENIINSQFNKRQSRQILENTTVPYILNHLNSDFYISNQHFNKCKGIELPAVTAIMGAALVQDFISSLNNAKVLDNLLILDAQNDEMLILEI